jgi:hypothetical protein
MNKDDIQLLYKYDRWANNRAQFLNFTVGLMLNSSARKPVLLGNPNRVSSAK